MEITAKWDREKIWRGGRSVRHLVARVTDPGEDRPVQVGGLNVALVVDASGSMEGPPIEFAIDAAQRVVRALSEDDRLSVVSFDNRVKDHVVAERMTAPAKERALVLLRGILAGGGTNLSEGWLRGAAHVAGVMDEWRATQNRVIVLSDGHANAGIVEPAVLGEHARELAVRGLYTSTVGIGDDYHGATLEAIAVQGGGTHHRAARPHEISEVVTAELSGIQGTAAVKLELRLEHARGVRVQSLNGFPLREEGGVVVCSLGSLGGGASRTAVFRVRFPEGEAGAECPVTVRGSWGRPGEEGVKTAAPVRVAVRFAPGAENDAQGIDEALAGEVAPVWQAYLVRRVVGLNRERRYDEALRRLDRDLPRFAKYAGHAAGGAALVEELQRLRAVANREWKEGSRKEVEISMLQRSYCRKDRRMDVFAQWTQHLPKPE